MSAAKVTQVDTWQMTKPDPREFAATTAANRAALESIRLFDEEVQRKRAAWEPHRAALAEYVAWADGERPEMTVEELGELMDRIIATAVAVDPLAAWAGTGKPFTD